METIKSPTCSPNNSRVIEGIQSTIDRSATMSTESPPTPFILPSSLAFPEDYIDRSTSQIVFKTGTSSITLRSIAMQPRLSPESSTANYYPQSLFMQALAKLNESANASSNFHSSVLRDMLTPTPIAAKPKELSPPDSLMSAPPSYSFVLRQIAARRRPRIVGTFIPSPSYIQHAPPPTYGAAFDIYLDNLPPLPNRVNNFGFAPMPVACPECGFAGLTAVTAKITFCTHLCALTLCVLCCWICVPLPYFLRSCKDVYHYCRNCRHFLGMYCPTNPQNTTL